MYRAVSLAVTRHPARVVCPSCPPSLTGRLPVHGRLPRCWRAMRRRPSMRSGCTRGRAPRQFCCTHTQTCSPPRRARPGGSTPLSHGSRTAPSTAAAPRCAVARTRIWRRAGAWPTRRGAGSVPVVWSLTALAAGLGPPAVGQPKECSHICAGATRRRPRAPQQARPPHRARGAPAPRAPDQALPRRPARMTRAAW